MQTMAVGWCVGKRYSRVQVGSVVVLTIGVIVSAWADAVGKVCFFCLLPSSVPLPSSFLDSLEYAAARPRWTNWHGDVRYD